jgi:hypothetical protein
VIGLSESIDSTDYADQQSRIMRLERQLQAAEVELASQRSETTNWHKHVAELEADLVKERQRHGDELSEVKTALAKISSQLDLQQQTVWWEEERTFEQQVCLTGGADKVKVTSPRTPLRATCFEDDLTKLERTGSRVDVRAIVKGMATFAARSRVQGRACQALGHLASGNDDNRTVIAAVGGIDSILVAMRTHQQDVKVSSEACAALCSIAIRPDNQIKIAAAGGIDRILAAMRSLKTEIKVQRYACAALSNLAENSDNQAMIAAAGGIGCIIAAMHCHKDDSKLQSNACGALSNLAVHDDNEAKIAAAGGIQCIIAAMQSHRHDSKVQIKTCWVLSNLAENAENQAKIAEAGGIEHMIAAMRNHTNDVEVQHIACAALRNLAMDNGNKVEIAAQGGIKCLLEAMRTHTHQTQVQGEAFAALMMLAENAQNKTKMLALADGDCKALAPLLHKLSARQHSPSRSPQAAWM